ncbi:MAG: PAS domain-containing sensor histidine kinase [Cytophagaceae bacterium]|nr:MAG: PAS domain-containing sensor histidine kinase [Cytophagaceae bacterium]
MNDSLLPANQAQQLAQRLDINFALQAAGLGIWEFNLATGLVVWDERCRTLFGLTQGSEVSYEEVVARIHPQDMGLVQQAMATALNSRSYEQYDVTFRVIGDGDSRLRWVRSQGRAEFTPAGELLRFGGITKEVTEQVVAWQALEKSEVKLQSIIDLAELGSYSIDVLTQRITKSPRVAEWYGLPEVTDVAVSISAIPPSDQERVSQVLADVLKPGSTTNSFAVEYPVISQRTGQRRVIRTNGQVKRDSAGQPIQIDGIVVDITAQRELQLTLQQQLDERTQALAATNEELAASNQEYGLLNKQLEEANDLLSRSNENLQQFAYVASHDLQEPLRKIQSFGNILKEQYKQQLGDDIDLLDRMQLAASRMSILIRDLLSYSRITTYRNDYQLIPLQEVITNVLTDLEMVITQTGAQVQVDLLPTVQGDSLQLGQLFQNLLSNALKFCRRDEAGKYIDSRIAIRYQQVMAADLPPSVKPAQATPAYHRIEVADSGIGFDEKYLGRIFQVFQRLHGKQHYSGTGIGLAICEKVVTNHGGAITASSQLGQGATFSVYLPMEH